MATSIVSKSAVWNPQLGNFVTTTKLADPVDYPAYPETARDVTKSVEGGLFTVTYKDIGDPSSPSPPGNTSNYNYEAHSTCSTEPLITFGDFGPGGAWALSDPQKQKIKDAEVDPTKWKTYAAGTDALAKYATFILRGIESYYAPSITLSITEDENIVPDLTYLGKIATVNNAPALPHGGNWLFSGCNFSALSNGKWRVTREYRASASGGWDPELYGNAGRN